jgi:hypothetical protein
MTPAYQGPVAYYAFGGGLGHLTRARAIRATLDLPEYCATFCSSPLACDPEFTEGLNPCLAPRELEKDVAAFRAWLRDCLDRFRPHWLFVDVFPAGILGELCDFPFPPGLRLAHVARILRWEAYLELLRGSLPSYHHIFAVERLTEEHRDRLASLSSKVEQLELHDPPSRLPSERLAAIRQRWSAWQRPVWLVVHSGPDKEIQDLLDYARDHAAMQAVRPAFVVVAPGHPLSSDSEIERINLYPACDLYPFADKIITAGGFNSIRQTRPFRDRHLALPLSRRFDDQFLRCRWMRGSPAD